MRLFSALLPPPPAVRGLATAGPAPDAGVRRVPPDRWHITLRFYGEDDPDAREPWLRERLTGARAPRLRLHGFGRFSGVTFVHVEEDGPGLLPGLARRAGAENDYVPHLTVARWRGRGGPRIHGDYTGSWFTPTEAVLMSSAGGAYAVLARFPLDPA